MSLHNTFKTIKILLVSFSVLIKTYVDERPNLKKFRLKSCLTKSVATSHFHMHLPNRMRARCVDDIFAWPCPSITIHVAFFILNSQNLEDVMAFEDSSVTVLLKIHHWTLKLLCTSFQISLKVARDEHQKQEQLHLDEKQELLDRIHEKDVQYQVWFACLMSNCIRLINTQWYALIPR